MLSTLLGKLSSFAWKTLVGIEPSTITTLQAKVDSLEKTMSTINQGAKKVDENKNPISTLKSNPSNLSVPQLTVTENVETKPTQDTNLDWIIKPCPTTPEIKVTETLTTDAQEKIDAYASKLADSFAKRREADKASPTYQITFDPAKFSFEMESLLGLGEQISFLRENVLIPAANPDLFAKLGVGLQAAKGIIFHGPATPEMANLAKALASELSRVMGQVEKDKVSDGKIKDKEGEKKKSFKFFERPKTKTFSKYSHEGSKFVVELFTEAKKEAPCVILFEDMHTISYPHYNNDLDFPDDSFISEVHRQMENLGSTEDVIVIATVPSLSLVPATHKLCFELKLAFPTKFDDETRTQIIKQTTSSWTVRPSIEILDMVTELSDSFHLEQLRRVGKMAYRSALRRALKEGRVGGCKRCANRPDNLKVDKSLLDGISPSEEDWVEACDAIKSQIAAAAYKRASCSREEHPRSAGCRRRHGGNVGGLEEQIKGLKENILFPLQNKDNLAEWGVHPVRGIIFHGPPGTGKTLLGRVLAAELTRLTSSSVKKNKFSFFYQKASDCFNLYVGETERNLRELFAEAEKYKPSIIFFDEMDGLCPSRDNSESSRWSNSTVATLLGLMDTVKRGEVFVIKIYFTSFLMNQPFTSVNIVYHFTAML
ncbi:cell division control protein 48 [Folsomia candida]|uniref:cell division control protein 48 n=1 Tax=Folsomia candida TaxID=158441 RepID=UPI000B901D77|nr:cell division control protein 48 [Folsomia candida]